MEITSAIQNLSENWEIADRIQADVEVSSLCCFKMVVVRGWQKFGVHVKTVVSPETLSWLSWCLCEINVLSLFSVFSLVRHQEEGGEGSRGSSCYGAGLRGQPHPSEEGGARRLRRRGGGREHRGHGHEIHPHPHHGYIQ